MITRKDVLAHLDPMVRSEFLVGQKGYVSKRAPFVKEFPSVKAYELFAALGDTPWPRLNSGTEGSGGTDTRTGAQISGTISRGQSVTVLGAEERSIMVNPLDYEVTVGIEHNAINDDRIGDLETWARDAGANFEKFKDKLAFSALNAGAASTYGLGYDGLTFFDDVALGPQPVGGLFRRSGVDTVLTGDEASASLHPLARLLAIGQGPAEPRVGTHPAFVQELEG